jgi:chromosome segregation ATPase
MTDADHRTCQLAIDAHKARADQQEARAIAAEEILAAFARNVEEHEQLAGQAAQGQRDSDVLKEIRRRIPPLERQAERAGRAEAKLAEVRRTIAAFFTHHGNSAAFALQSARDLAEGIRQVLDRVPLEPLEGGKETP